MTSLRIHMGRTLALGLPLVGSQLAQVVIGVTDTIMLGRYSVEALAAATLGSSLFFTLFLLGAGPGHRRHGGRGRRGGPRGRAHRPPRRADERLAVDRRGPDADAGHVVLPRRSCWRCASCPRTRAGAQAYLRVAMLGIVPSLMTMSFRSHLSALERTRVVLWSDAGGGGAERRA